MRNILNKYGAPIAIVLLLSAGAWYYFTAKSNRIATNAYFMDEETGEELVLPRVQHPPLPGKSGKLTVVGVFKFTCDEKKTIKIGYYWKLTDSAKQKLNQAAAANQPEPQLADNAMLIRSPAKDSPWVSWNSDAGANIRSTLVCPEGHDIDIVLP